MNQRKISCMKDEKHFPNHDKNRQKRFFRGKKNKKMKTKAISKEIGSHQNTIYICKYDRLLLSFHSCERHITVVHMKKWKIQFHRTNAHL